MPNACRDKHACWYARTMHDTCANTYVRVYERIDLCDANPELLLNPQSTQEGWWGWQVTNQKVQWHEVWHGVGGV